MRHDLLAAHLASITHDAARDAESILHRLRRLSATHRGTAAFDHGLAMIERDVALLTADLQTANQIAIRRARSA